jgi:excisionase family DNA binding protein
LNQLEPFSIAEAARYLGLTEDAVRKRIKRGELQARKQGKAWQVFLEPSQNGQNGIQNAIQNESKTNQNEQERLIAHLQEEISFLKSQLESEKSHLWEQVAKKDEQIRELLADIASWREQVRYKELQLAQAQERVIELPQPEAEEEESGEPEPDTNRNPLVRFWHWFAGKE